MRSNNNNAVSAVVGLILVLGIISSIVTATLVWALPYMNDKKAMARLESSLEQFTKINDAVEEITTRGYLGSRMVNFKSEDGYLSIGNSGTRFVIFYSMIDYFQFFVKEFEDTDETTFVYYVESQPLRWRDHTTDLPPGDDIDDRDMKFEIFSLTAGSLEEVITIDDVNEKKKYEISCLNYLNDAVQIDIINGTSVLVGRIWLFDIGYITYETSSATIDRTLTLENLGVITENPAGASFTQKPSYYAENYWITFHEQTYFIMKIVLYRIDAGLLDSSSTAAEVSFGPTAASFRLLLQLDKQKVGENQHFIKGTPTREHFRMQIFGDHASLWYDYFDSLDSFKQKTNYGYKYLVRTKGICYSLMYNFCTIDVEVLS
jgi:hypothetical protein